MRVFNAAQQLLVDQNRVSKPATAPTAARPAAPAAPAPAPRPAPAAAAVPAPSAPAQPVAAQPAPAPVPAKPAQPAAAEKKSVETLWIHDDLDLDSLDLDEELAKLEEQEMQLSREFLAIDSAPKSGAQLLNADEEDSRHDESWAESLIKDEPPRKTATMAPVRPRPEPAPEPLRAEPQVRAKPVEEPPAERDEPPLGNLSAADEEDASWSVVVRELLPQPVHSSSSTKGRISGRCDIIRAGRVGRPWRAGAACRSGSCWSLHPVS